MCSQRVRKVWSSQVPVGWGKGENKWFSFWGLVLLLLIQVSVLLVSAWIYIRRGTVTEVGVYPARRCTSLSGRARWVGGWRLATVTTPPISKKSGFEISVKVLFGVKIILLSRRGILLLDTAGYTSSKAGAHSRWVP